MRTSDVCGGVCFVLVHEQCSGLVEALHGAHGDVIGSHHPGLVYHVLHTVPPRRPACSFQPLRSNEEEEEEVRVSDLTFMLCAQWLCWREGGLLMRKQCLSEIDSQLSSQRFRQNNVITFDGTCMQTIPFVECQ